MNLEELNYPMFETNFIQKLVLRRVLKNITEGSSAHWLCINLMDYFWVPTIMSLTRKVHNESKGLLEGLFYLEYPEVFKHKRELRVVWINKLLAYSPENN